jgi:AcrR family transcriptional regulator
MSAPRTARQRVRDELTREIKDVARRHLAEQGSAALSLRAVARELGMASSAVYRYFATRDELLTALIVDAYDSVGEAAEGAEAKVDRGDLLERWLQTAVAVRGWALGHRYEYELIFGSPVPGYAAPQVTIDPAARIPLLLVGIVRDAGGPGEIGSVPEVPEEVPEPVRADLSGLAELLELAAPPAVVAEMLMAWTGLIGCISFEMFGHLVGSVTDYDTYFRYQMTTTGRRLGLDRNQRVGTS